MYLKKKLIFLKDAFINYKIFNNLTINVYTIKYNYIIID